MVSVEDAEKAILESVSLPTIQSVPILDSAGRVLAEEICAERDYPPFDRVTMDGIGICFDAYAEGRREFIVAGVVGAGDKPLELQDIQTCLEVMTGAVCPPGVDCVIPVELLTIDNRVAHLNGDDGKIQKAWNIHPQGSDCRSGKSLLRPGLTLNSASIAVAASEGAETVKVYKIPKVAVISSGNELVELSAKPEPWQIRRSNSYTIAAQLRSLRLADVEVFHVADEVAVIEQTFKSLLEEFDILIMSGAVSKGKFDYIPGVLEKLKVEKLFHCITQRPGKPMWYGLSENKKLVFALPGNPVSTVVGFTRYVVPAILKLVGSQRAIKQRVSLKSPFKFKKSFTYFLPVKISSEGSRLLAEPSPVNGSGDFSALAFTDGFVELPAAPVEFPEGMEVDFYSWDQTYG